MAARLLAPPPPELRALPTGRRSRRDWIWLVCSVLAAASLAAAAFMPLWGMTLRAPQYPGGLNLTAYGTHLSGDLREINALNHYVGIQSLHPETITELKLFPFAIGALVVMLLAGGWFARHRMIRLVIAAAVWAVPLGMLADMQWWLHRYGQNLDPDAPIRLDPFTPKVLGTTEVINFHSEAMVSAGFWLMVFAALLVTVGPWAVRFVRDAWANTGSATAAALLVAALTAGLGGAHPSKATAAGQPPRVTPSRSPPGPTASRWSSTAR